MCQRHFYAEIDRLNSVRDFALNWQKNNNNNVEVFDRIWADQESYSKSFIEAYWPSIEHSNRYLGENINKFLKDRGCRFFKRGQISSYTKVASPSKYLAC